MPAVPVRVRSARRSPAARCSTAKSIHHADIVPLLDTEFSGCPGKRTAHRLPRRARGAADARRRRVRRDLPVAARAGTVRAGPGRARADVCPAGRDRDRERAAVQGGGGPQPRSHRGAGAAEGDERHPARHLPVANGRASRCSTPLSRARFACADADVQLLLPGSTASSSTLLAFHGSYARGARTGVQRQYPDAPEPGGIIQARGPSLATIGPHLPTCCDDPEYVSHEFAIVGGFRSVLGVPMLRDGRAHRGHRRRRDARPRPFLRPADRAPQDLRRPGGHRGRERAPVHGGGSPQPGSLRVARATGSDQRDPARDRGLADGYPAGPRYGRPRRRPISAERPMS